ncbi:hypothetical protein EXT60_05770 [Pectobacterium carotovorum subsp. carotovorum]|nr:hypothetical protein [Pectobacterium carotovorum]MCL6363744.1 hypothetical protein [Pectobacterium carotovorum subsp. carotovorum]
MMDQKSIEKILEEMARIQGYGLNGQDRLMIRTRVSAALSAKERYRQGMESLPYQWKKPDKRRR